MFEELLLLTLHSSLVGVLWIISNSPLTHLTLYLYVPPPQVRSTCAFTAANALCRCRVGYTTTSPWTAIDCTTVTSDAEWRSGNMFLQASADSEIVSNEDGATNIELAEVLLLLRHYMARQTGNSDYAESQTVPCARCDSWSHIASACPHFSAPRVSDDVKWAEAISRDVFLRNLCVELTDAAHRAGSAPTNERILGKPRYAVVNDADSTGEGFKHYAAIMFRIDVDPDIDEDLDETLL